MYTNKCPLRQICSFERSQRSCMAASSLLLFFFLLSIPLLRICLLLVLLFIQPPLFFFFGSPCYYFFFFFEVVFWKGVEIIRALLYIWVRERVYVHTHAGIFRSLVFSEARWLHVSFFFFFFPVGGRAKVVD